MQEWAGLEWDHIDQPTLEEVERSWAHSAFEEVNTSDCDSVSVCYLSHSTPHIILFLIF